MERTPGDAPKVDVAAGVFAALVLFLVIGFFLMPILPWLFVVAAFLGFLVATRGRREHERKTGDPYEYPTLDRRRPWIKDDG
ncbi:hypothetical protein [Streptomyces albidus (ex Kaewkla and Franco 2022)]|uniref:hypothetical protein n=1 Tax=Streptomyces albidus (ex Kaewkla and Franco 2022) TaxID=722709 RepID=UPI0015EE8095|nr:hypothetical protein [Streptomyces albidus (ex Kaewkla and Franco 2022)]